MRPIYYIVKQEYPDTPWPYRILEVVMTSDGPRTRVADGCWKTFEEAKGVTKAKKVMSEICK